MLHTMAMENLEMADAAGGPVECTDEINAGEDTNDEATAGGIGPTPTFRCVSVADEMVRQSMPLMVVTMGLGCAD